MTLFGSLFTGVAALNAQSQSLTVISNNIANSQTDGYKRSVAAFSNLVTGFDSQSVLQPGGVRASAVQRVTQQGLLRTEVGDTNLGVLGEGMFVVGFNDTQEIQFPFFTRDGRFDENEFGQLQNQGTGAILYGWRLDDNGDIPANFDNLSSLEPINLNFLPGFNRPTSNVEAAINLNSEQPTQNAVNILSTPPPPGGAVAGFGAAAPLTDPDFERVITVFDSLGASQELGFRLSKTHAPNLSTVESVAAGNPRFELDTDFFDITTTAAPGDTFSIDVGSGAQAITIPAGATSFTVADLLDQINGIAGATAFLDQDGQIVVQATDPAQAVTIAGITAPGTDAFSGLFANGAVGPLPAPPGAGSFTNNPGFPALQTVPPTNPQGWWLVEFDVGDQIQQGYINFNPDGTINALQGPDGEIDVNLTGINFGNGSAPQDIAFDLSSLSQLNSNFLTTFINQNGTSFGVRQSIAIDEEGFVNVTFSNGRVIPTYKIPLADFPNFNGLNSESRNVFTATDESGEVSLREANLNGSGTIFSNSLESSNVDLADEFSRLIITQRAYSAGTRIIDTADQLLAELLNIR